MKTTLLQFALLVVLTAFWSCSDHEESTPEVPPANIPEGWSCSSEQVDADQTITITFKAPKSSALYGYEGDVYLHAGIINEGNWMYVPADWNENIDKCKCTPTDTNIWSITLSPSIREWFGSGTTPVKQLGLVIRSADGSRKGQDEDYFINITDSKYQGFQPAPIKEQSLPTGMQHGINTDAQTNSVTLVLYDRATDGTYKDYAYVVGDFNQWTLANNESSQMYRDPATGCWWITLGNLDPKREYAFQYYVGTTGGNAIRLADPYTEKILDPDNDKYIAASTYPETERNYPEGGNGIVSTFRIHRENFAWSTPDFKVSDPTNLIIYELLLRDFTATKDLNGAMQKLDYLKQLGVNTIELMPIQEFDGNDSWGYNPCFYFALDKSYGTPQQYKEFIDRCHSLGIAVLLDVVYNHATNNMPFARMYWDGNRPAANNPWFNQEAPHPYSVFNDFNHESRLTREFVKRNLKYLLNEYKIDGFRFDLTKGFTNQNSTEMTSGNYDASRIEILKDYHQTIRSTNPDALMICEHLAGKEEESELAADGIKLWRNLNNAYCQSAMGWLENSSFEELITCNNGIIEKGWIGYMESHDEERCAYKQIRWGNGILQTDQTAQMKQLETNAAFFFSVPGPKMIWQFEELGYDISINANTQGEVIEGEEHRTDRKPLHWEYYTDPARKGLYDVYAKLLNLRKTHANLFQANSTFSWNVDNNYWSGSTPRSITLKNGNDMLYVIGNFGEEDANAISLPDGIQYNYMTGEEVSGNITVPAHSFFLGTSFMPQ